MQRDSLEQIGQRLIGHLCCQQARDEVLHHAVLRHLSRRRPITTDMLAKILGWSQTEVEERLAHVPDLERDPLGRIVGWGLTLLSTSHCLLLQGRQLSTWCALDTLIYPVCLDQVVPVESDCPITQQAIRFTVSPMEIADVQPAQAIMSLVLPGAREDCSREHFCGQSHFFVSGAAASTWKQAHPEAFLLSMEEAAQLGRWVATARITQIREASKTL